MLVSYFSNEIESVKKRSFLCSLYHIYYPTCRTLYGSPGDTLHNQKHGATQSMVDQVSDLILFDILQAFNMFDNSLLQQNTFFLKLPRYHTPWIFLLPHQLLLHNFFCWFLLYTLNTGILQSSTVSHLIFFVNTKSLGQLNQIHHFKFHLCGISSAHITNSNFRLFYAIIFQTSASRC